MQLSIESFPPVVQPLLRRLHIDFRPRTSPSMLSLGIATIVAIVGSLIADYVLVKIGVSTYPATKGYVHFAFHDYAKLTVIGILGAAIGWPIVTRISSQPKWLYLRAAVLVTIVLFLPDVYIWIAGSSFEAVFVLVWMHLAIAVVTYCSMVLIAPTHSRR